MIPACTSSKFSTGNKAGESGVHFVTVSKHFWKEKDMVRNEYGDCFYHRLPAISKFICSVLRAPDLYLTSHDMYDHGKVAVGDLLGHHRARAMGVTLWDIRHVILGMGYGCEVDKFVVHEIPLGDSRLPVVKHGTLRGRRNIQYNILLSASYGHTAEWRNIVGGVSHFLGRRLTIEVAEANNDARKICHGTHSSLMPKIRAEGLKCMGR